jgi:hypothetical protein
MGKWRYKKKSPIVTYRKRKIFQFYKEKGKKKVCYCYNCLKKLDKKDVTREHIPAKNLFVGYDERYKVNRITVPACYTCNNQYSPTDKEFRNMIGIIAKRKENHKITEKAVKSITESFNSDRLIKNPFGEISGIKFDQTPIEDFHKKNFKGLYYFQFGKPLSDEYELFVNIDEADYSDFTLGVLGYLKDMFNWKHSGHSDILSYCVQPFRLGITNDAKEDLALLENEDFVVGCIKYNQEHAALVIAVRKSYLDEIKRKKTQTPSP